MRALVVEDKGRFDGCCEGGMLVLVGEQHLAHYNLCIHTRGMESALFTLQTLQFYKLKVETLKILNARHYNYVSI